MPHSPHNNVPLPERSTRKGHIRLFHLVDTIFLMPKQWDQASFLT